MNPSIRIRDACYPDDFPAIAAVITAEHGDWPVSAEELATAEAARDPRYWRLELLAEDGGEVVGVGSVGHIPYAHQEGRFGLDLRVRPDFQGRGAGKALYDALMVRLAPLQPRELMTEVWEALPRPRRFLEERGFAVTWRRVDSILDPRGVDFSPYAGLEERLGEQGITVTTYDRLAGDPDRARKLHALDWALLQDMPYGEAQTLIPLEQFIGDTLNNPDFLPEACFIARQGEEWIGYSNLLRGDGFFVIQMTGVLAAWRGRGLATLLKLKGIHYALDHGGHELRTENDEINGAMLAINRKLGFRETGATLRYKKRIGLENEQESGKD